MSEILGTLFKYLLALLAITAVVVVLYEALGSSTTSSEVAGLTQMQANIYQLYEGESGSPTALPATASGLIGAGVVPSSMITGGQTINDPWGGTITFPAPATSAVAAITIPDVPVSSCAKLVTSVVTAGASVAGGSAAAYPSDVGAGTLALNAASVCAPASGSSSGESITISFYPSTGASANAAPAKQGS